MSEPKLISPMLDDFDMGGPISDHDGVRCCPAMRKNSDEKYIVKIISVPASQTKMDALLLTGAYPDRVSALAYFMELANGIVDEKKILDNLAQLEGFVSYEDCQIVPMDDGSGYDVYLLGEYRMTLERQNARTPMTQLAAVNLGLDLCAALSVCRRSGYMCVDLKPSNIYVVGDKEYKIGDLGFVRLNSLKYESLPDMYRSSYTAPEVEAAFAPLNDTMDIYAVGLILYQVFNGGTLPFSGKIAPNEHFESPAYADAEMAEIILKACAPDPAERWADPVQMGQAIVNYMQKNGVNDTPLVAASFAPSEEPCADTEIEEISAEPEIALDLIEEADTAENADKDYEVQADEDNVVEDTSDSVLLFTDQIAAALSTEAVLNESEITADALQSEEALLPEEKELPEDINELLFAEESADLNFESPVDGSSEEEVEYDNLSFLDDYDEESAQVLAEFGDDYDGVTDELSEMLDQIDALTAHQIPDPVVAPDPIEIKMPDPIPVDEPEEFAATDEALSSVDSDNKAEFEEDIPEEEMPYIPKKKRTGLVWTIVLALLLAFGVGGYLFYTQYYLQPIHTLIVEGSEDILNVQLTADIDESELTIICADPHGKKIAAPVVGGKATFSGLTPDTAYTVSVEITGFHKLTGMTSKVYSTPLQTKILQMSTVTGSESGSVILSFAVEGPDSDQWNVIYSAEGEAERVTAFPSHMVTLAGLTVGKEYTFRLEPVDDIYISGVTEITYVAQDLVCAENLHVTACADGALTVQWDTPDGANVSEWTVRCYNQSGYDQTIVTADNTITFHDVDDTAEHTVEVIAAGMSVNQRVVVGENSVTVSNFTVDSSRPDVLTLSWNTNREIPADGWTIRYSVDGINAPAAITANENSVKVPVIPNANYVFTIQDGSGNPVLGGPFTHEQRGAESFAAFDVSKDDITVSLCKTPSASSWSYRDLAEEDYVNSFSTGEKISVVLALDAYAESSEDVVITTFAIYDEDGNLVSFSDLSQTWQSMWYQNYCELDIPSIPTEIGTYNAIIYFNGTEVGSQKFEITA